MNTLVGRVDTSTQTGRSWAGGGAYRQFLKLGDIPNPARTWVFLDEHPDTVNDGFFVAGNTNVTAWGDFPGALHDGSTTFAFADGHVELRKWRSSTSRIPVRFSYAPAKPFDALGRQDIVWYNEHCGYVPF